MLISYWQKFQGKPTKQNETCVYMPVNLSELFWIGWFVQKIWKQFAIETLEKLNLIFFM